MGVIRVTCEGVRVCGCAYRVRDRCIRGCEGAYLSIYMITSVRAVRLSVAGCPGERSPR